jgi:hypothetical protein
MFNCDRSVVIGFITGVLITVGIIGATLLNDTKITLGVLGPIIGLIALYIAKREKWISKEQDYERIQEEIKSMLKNHETM